MRRSGEVSAGMSSVIGLQDHANGVVSGRQGHHHFALFVSLRLPTPWGPYPLGRMVGWLCRFRFYVKPSGI